MSEVEAQSMRNYLHTKTEKYSSGSLSQQFYRYRSQNYCSCCGMKNLNEELDGSPLINPHQSETPIYSKLGNVSVDNSLDVMGVWNDAAALAPGKLRVS